MQIEGWVEYKGSEITTKITKGSSPKWQGFDYQNDGTLFVTSENVREGFLDISNPKYLSLEFNKKLKNSQLEVGDILINIVGASIGRSCQFNIDNQLANINQAVCLFRTNELVDKNYIQQYLQLPSTINRLLGTQTESARPNLSLGDLRDFTFILPPKSEQKKIAEILSTWDKAIETVEKLVANSQQQKKALMQQLLTGQKRLLDDNGVKFGGEWEEFSISDLCKIGRGRVISKTEIEENFGSYPVYSSQTLSNGIMGYLNSYDFDGEYVTWTTDGVNAGTVFYRNGKFNCTNVCGTLSPKNNLINLKFLALALSRVAFKYVSHTLANPKLMNGVMGTITIQVPKIEEQEKIAQVLTLADQEIELYQQQLDKLKLEKKALMQQLLTGQKRVIID